MLRRRLKVIILKLASILLLVIPVHFLKAQNCDPGADGITPVGGGVTQLANGQVCANKMDMVDLAVINILYTNVDFGGDPTNVEFFIDWDDGTTQTLFYPADITRPAFPLNSFEAIVTHLFPATGGAVQCEYVPEVFLQFNGTPCPGSLASPPAFVRWNTDNELTGNHLLAEQATSQVTFPVCAGESFPVFFSDQSTFNCVPPAYLNLINDRQRWTQFEYGTTNTITSATGVQVGGVIEAYPYLTPETTAGPPVTAPFATTLDITVPADAQVGEEFEITMYTWNFCNPFGVDPPIVTTARILIIDSPPAPIAPPTDFCVGAPVSVAVAGTGGTFDWYTDVGLTNNVFTGNPFDPTSDPPAPIDRLDNSFQNSRTYYVTETLGNNCVGPATTVIFNIYDNPTPSNAGGDFAVCSQTSQLNGNVPVIGTGFWTSSGPGNVVAGQETMPNANIEFLGDGTSSVTTTFTWTITNGGICVSASSVDVTRDQLPSPADAGIDKSLCLGSNVFLSGAAPAVGIGTWSIVFPLVLTTETIVDPNDPATQVTGLVAGTTYILEWEVNNLSCTPPAIPPNIDQMQIFNFLDPPADPGPDIDVCTANAFLDAGVPPAGTGQWLIVAPAQTTEAFVDDTDPKTEITGLIAGTTYTLSWSVTNGVCFDTDIMTLIRSLPPDVSVAGPDQAICADNTLLAANTPVSGTGLWTVTAGSGTFVDDTDPNTAVNTLGLGANIFTWTIDNSCGSNSDDVIITNDNPVAADAGMDRNICGTGTDLDGNSPLPDTGLWTEIAGDGLGFFTDPTDPITPFNGTIETTYTLRWTISNVTCPDTFDDVTIRFDAAPTAANAGPPQTICGTSAILAGNAPAIGNGLWVELAGDGLGAFVDDTNPVTTFSGTTGVAYTLEWRISNGACLPSTDIVSIQFDQNPTPAAAGPDQVVCGGSTNLAATPLVIGTGSWAEIAGDGNGAYVDNSSPTTLFTGTPGITYTLQWTTSNGVCPPTSDNVIIQFDANPTIALAGGDQTLCATSALMAANIPGTGSGQWSEIAGDGLGSFILDTDPLTTFTGTAGMTYTLRWTISNGVCPSSDDDVIIQFDANPDVSNAGPNQDICGTSTALAANTPLVGAGQWTEIAGDGLGLFALDSDPSTNFTGTGGVLYTLRWTISNGVCVDSQDDVDIQFDQDPTTADAGPDKLICGITTNLEGNNPTIGTGLWTFLSNPDGMGVIVNDTQFNTAFDGTPGETYVLQWTISNGVCVASMDNVDITFGPPLPPTTISGDANACVGDVKTYIIPGGDPALYTYTWDLSGLPPSTTVVPGSGTPFQFISIEFFDPVLLGVLSVITEDKATLCLSPPETIAITVYQSPIMSLVSSDADLTICENDEVTFTATDLLGIADFFEFQLNGSTVQSGPSNIYITSAIPTINSITVIGTAPGGICSAESAPPIIHVVNPIPNIFNVSGGGDYCAGGAGVSIGLDGSEVGITYELYLDGNPTAVTDTPGGGAFSFPNQTTSGIYTVFALSASNCGEFMAGNTSITINLLPLAFNINGGGDYCEGESGVALGLDNSEPGIDYQLFRDGVPQGSSLPGSGVALDFGLQTLQGDYTIVGTNPVTFCSQVMNDIATVNAITTPDIVFSNNQPGICSGSPTSIDLISGVAGSTFTWTAVVSDPSLTGASDEINPQPIGVNVQQTLFNSSSDVQSVTYTVEALGPAPSLCVGDTQNIIVEVYPAPTAQIIGETTICSGTSTSLTFLSEGDVPFDLTFTDGTEEFFLNDIASTHVINVNPTSTTVYSIVSITDSRNCAVSSPGNAVTVTVVVPESDFSTEQNLSGCGPYEITFTNNNVQPGITYEWSWGDGSQNTRTSELNVTHVYQNISNSPLTYNMSLTATEDILGCQTVSFESIEVLPSVTPIIDVDQVEGCAPLLVSFVNNSLGVNEHKWFYRVKGTTDEIDIRNTPSVTYSIGNETTSSLLYEVVYIASNGFCDESIITEIFVLPELTATFNLSQDSVEVMDTPHVAVTNTTLNKDSWSHFWNWGDGTTSTSVDPGDHIFVNEFGAPTYGTFQVTQSITYEGEDGSCDSESTQDFTVLPVFPLVDFEADILEGCLPLDVTFNNLSVAIDQDQVKWEFYDSEGELIGVSNDYNARFIFFDQGSYTIKLTAGNVIGIEETEIKELYITVYSRPTAGFTLRPQTVYLPDGIMFTQNQSTPDADEFFWVFNYLEYEAGVGQEFDLTSTLYEPQISYKQKGFKDIMLVATASSTGCSDTSLVEKAVFVDEGGFARVPNAFTPNDRGPGASTGSGSPGSTGDFNEVFLPVVDGLATEPGSFRMLIFDRWGNLLFESWDRNVGWDGYNKNGTLLPMGVYVYKLDLRYEDGNSGVRIGDVTLIR